MTDLNISTPASRSLLGSIGRGLKRRLAEWSANRSLHGIDDHILKDIGLTRGEIKAALRGKVHRPDYD
jgi:uncharacterized protein YjiS (DUF1127 family)